MRYTFLFILLCFFALCANANQRLFEAIITVDSAGNAIKLPERITLPINGFYSVRGKPLQKEGGLLYHLYTNFYQNIYIRRSDNGVQWSDPVIVNDSVTQISSTSLFEYAIGTVNLKHRIVVLWVTKGDSLYSLFSSYSTDSGKTFSSPHLLHKEILERSYRCINVTADSLGNFYCTWTNRNRNDTLATVWLVATTDGGVTWSPPVVNAYNASDQSYSILFTDVVAWDDSSLAIFAPANELNIFYGSSDVLYRRIIERNVGDFTPNRLRSSSIWKDPQGGYHCLYSANTTSSSMYVGVFHRYSSDHGMTWSGVPDLVEVFSDPPSSFRPGDGVPSVTFSPSGKMFVIAAIMGKLHLYTSVNNGVTWKTTIVSDTSLAHNMNPSIVYLGSGAGNDSLLVSWIDYRELSSISKIFDKPSLAAHIYPNPAKDKIQIALELSEPQRLKFTITDVLGKKVHEQEPQLYRAGKETVELSIDRIQTSGIYLLRITTDKGEQTIQRIAVEK